MNQLCEQLVKVIGQSANISECFLEKQCL